MRDAVHVQRHRIPSMELDALTVVQESATRTIDARKTTAGTSSVHNSTGRRGGRARGRSVSGQLTVGGHGRGQGRGESERLLSTLRE